MLHKVYFQLFCIYHQVFWLPENKTTHEDSILYHAILKTIG